MKKFKDKQEVYEMLLRSTGGTLRNLVLTGSTAMKMLGFTDQADKADLDLIVYEITDRMFDTLKTIHSFNGVEAVNYDHQSSNRDAGGLISLSFPAEDESGLFEIKVHLFLMKSRDKISTQNREPIFLRDAWGKSYGCFVNSPMNIIEAKKSFGRPKDYMQLADYCNNILKPLEKKVLVAGCDLKASPPSSSQASACE